MHFRSVHGPAADGKIHHIIALSAEKGKEREGQETLPICSAAAV